MAPSQVCPIRVTDANAPEERGPVTTVVVIEAAAKTIVIAPPGISSATQACRRWGVFLHEPLGTAYRRLNYRPLFPAVGPSLTEWVNGVTRESNYRELGIETPADAAIHLRPTDPLLPRPYRTEGSYRRPSPVAQ
jgi:hypothetical protein